jgi:hypothetical protein
VSVEENKSHPLDKSYSQMDFKKINSTMGSDQYIQGTGAQRFRNPQVDNIVLINQIMKSNPDHFPKSPSFAPENELPSFLHMPTEPPKKTG